MQNTVPAPVPTISDTADRWRQALQHSDYPPYCTGVLNAFIDLIIERDWSQTEAARQVKHGRGQKALSGAALSQLLNGAYKADPVALCQAIEKTVNQHRARALFAVAGFVETRLAGVISDLADIAVITQRIACLHGGMLCGKTTNAVALASRYDRAACVLMTAPYADSYGGFVRRLAAVRGVSLRGTISDLRERILQTLDDSHLLIIDEFHQPLISYPRKQAERVFAFIREINDLRRCGILLVGATAGFAVLSADEEFSRLAAAMTSVDLRGKKDLTASGPGGDDDLAAVLTSFRLAPDPERLALLRSIAAEHTLARVFDTLRIASGRASKRKQTLSWQHVLDVVKPILQLAA